MESNSDNPNDRASDRASDLARARKSLRSPDNATIRDVADLSDINALADAKGYVTTRESSTITKRDAKYGIDENALTVLLRNLKLVCARIRFHKRYLVARRRQIDRGICARSA